MNLSSLKSRKNIIFPLSFTMNWFKYSIVIWVGKGGQLDKFTLFSLFSPIFFRQLTWKQLIWKRYHNAQCEHYLVFHQISYNSCMTKPQVWQTSNLKIRMLQPLCSLFVHTYWGHTINGLQTWQQGSVSISPKDMYRVFHHKPAKNIGLLHFTVVWEEKKPLSKMIIR